jgi:hypothetical protein
MNAAYETAAAADPFDRVFSSLTSLATRLSSPEALTVTHEQAEADVEAGSRELGRLLLQAHLEWRARHEENHLSALYPQERAALAGGRSRLEKGHRRQLATVLGPVTVTRCALRGAGMSNLYPADAMLGLSHGRHSLGLRRLAVLEAARGSYDTALEAIDRGCGGRVVGKRQVEDLVRAAAVDVVAFYTARTAHPAPAGEKSCRKRMATLAVVHDAEPAVRRPHDIIARPGGRTGHRTVRKGPTARAKWLTASVREDAETVIAAAFDQAEARDPEHHRTWVVLIDGATHQRELIQAEAARRNATTHIVLDIVHVIEKLWAAARCFHTATDPATEDWVGAKTARILAGDAPGAAHDIRAEADRRHLTDGQRTAADTACRYLENNADFVHYDQALASGWPITSGAVEGAARHLVADRLDITGSRWTVPGAEAVLTLRTVISNGDFPDYWIFHTRKEHERLHPLPDQHINALQA